MADLRQRKGMVAALAVVALAVWGAVALSVFRASSGADVPEPITRPAPDGVGEGPVGPPEPYVGVGRDPFAPLADLRPRTASAGPIGSPEARPVDPYDEPPGMSFDEALAYGAGPSEPAPPPDPPWQLRGLVGDRAIFEGPGGQSVVVGEGDRIGDIVVHDISATVVVLRTEGYDFLYDTPGSRRTP